MAHPGSISEPMSWATLNPGPKLVNPNLQPQAPKPESLATMACWASGVQGDLHSGTLESVYAFRTLLRLRARVPTQGFQIF